MATVSSHILDSIIGASAAGIRVQLVRIISATERQLLFDTNADQEGRIAETVVIDPALADSEYELIFHSAGYFAGRAIPAGEQQIIKTVVIRFSMPDAGQRYHIPLMLSPHAYSVWWSS